MIATANGDGGHLPLDDQLDELDSHLEELLADRDPAARFNASLYDRINYQLGSVGHPDLTSRFLPRLGFLLRHVADTSQTATTDWTGYPRSLIRLTIKLLKPVPFTEGLDLCPAGYLIHALNSPEPYINELALAILEKASRSPLDASILACTPALLEAFLHTWLTSPAVSVGQQGVLILGDVLDVDCPLSQPVFTHEQKQSYDIRLVRRSAQGHGSVWRRLFGDESLCWRVLQDLDADITRHAAAVAPPAAPAAPAAPAPARGARAAAQRSFAQDRLLRLLPRLAVLDFSSLTTPTPTTASLLRFAVLEMVDRNGDELMHLAWIDFMQQLVGAMRVADTAGLSAHTLRTLIRDAHDAQLIDALWAMPDNPTWTPPGDAEPMRAWLRQLAPRQAARIGGAEPPMDGC